MAKNNFQCYFEGLISQKSTHIEKIKTNPREEIDEKLDRKVTLSYFLKNYLWKLKTAKISYFLWDPVPKAQPQNK